MRGNKVILPVLIFVALLILFSACANTRSIEETIMQFQDASNAQDFNSFKDTLSPASDLWVQGDPTILDFLTNVMGARKPVTYSSLTININAIDATVTAVADYKALPNVPVRFEMRNHDDIWKIRQYWEDIGSGDTLIWFKLIDSIPLD